MIEKFFTWEKCFNIFLKRLRNKLSRNKPLSFLRNNNFILILFQHFTYKTKLSVDNKSIYKVQWIQFQVVLTDILSKRRYFSPLNFIDEIVDRKADILQLYFELDLMIAMKGLYVDFKRESLKQQKTATSNQ